MARATNVLSLFSGIGGLELGLERAGMTVVGQVEIDPFCRRVLAKHWPEVPRHDDVRTAADWWLSKERPTVDVICGGFPCQDISAGGRRAGISGVRSGLWAAMADTVRRIRPRYMLVENVPRILVRARDGIIPLEVVAADLAEIGYDLRWDCVPAAAVGAPHLRDRWFGIAYAGGERLRDEPIAEPWCSGAAIARNDGSPEPLADSARRGRQDEPRRGDTQDLPIIPVAGTSGGTCGGSATAGVVRPDRSTGVMASDVANADRSRLADVRRWPSIAESAGQRAADSSSWWRTEPSMGRVVDGISTRMDRRNRRNRVRALGNAVVPQVAEQIGQLIVMQVVT